MSRVGRICWLQNVVLKGGRTLKFFRFLIYAHPLDRRDQIQSRLKPVHLPVFHSPAVPDICVLLLFFNPSCHIDCLGKLIWTLDALCSQVLQKSQLDYIGMNCIFSLIYYMFPFNSKIGEIYVSGIDSSLIFQLEFLLLKVKQPWFLAHS